MIIVGEFGHVLVMDEKRDGVINLGVDQLVGSILYHVHVWTVD
jgi:hypothetical protein